MTNPTTEYLEVFEKYAPEETYEIQKSVVRNLETHCDTVDLEGGSLRIDHVIDFVIEESNSFPEETLRRRLTVLSNFLAYLWKNDPDVILANLGVRLDELDEYNGPEIGVNLSEYNRKSIELLIDRIRETYDDMRLRAVIELILSTHARLSAILKLDIDDIVFHECTVTVSIPDSHVVSQYNLCTSREVKISHRATKAVEAYCQSERSPPLTNERPLFSTAITGRVSDRDLRDDLKEAHKSLVDSSFRKGTLEKLDDGHGVLNKRFTMRDIWRYSFTTIRV